MKVGIIGGGIAGLTTALALQKAGIDFHLFEQSPEFREVGAGILLNTSTQHLLNLLGVGNHFAEASIPIYHFSIATFQDIKVRDVPFKKHSYSIHRAKLIDVLKQPLNPNQYTLNARIENVDQSATKATITVKNSIHEFDIIIAADGIQSATRQKFIPLLTPRYTKQKMWRGISYFDMPDHFKDCIYELWGNNKRFGIMHMGNNKYFWYTVIWAKEGEKDHELTLKEDIKKIFAEYHLNVHELIDRSEPIIKTDVKDIEPNNFTWFNNRIAFVGDAIHATTPHLSQGACQSIESAYTIVACLVKYQKNFQAAFQHYQQLRKHKAQQLNKLSFFFGRFSHQRKPWQDKLINLGLKLVPQAYINYKFDESVDLNYLKDLHF